MPKVYVVQTPTKMDPQLGKVPKFDVSTAAHYGELVHVFGERNISREVHQLSYDYMLQVVGDMTDHDFLLPLGDPVVIALVTAAALSNPELGKLQLLKWNRQEDRYLPVLVQL